MIKKLLGILIVLVAALVVTAYVLYLGNGAPVVPVVAAEEATSGKPYVIKLHAQWCPVCMITKSVWSRIEGTYSGRVNLVVLDFTSEANTAASRGEAVRLGLEKFYDEYAGATGIVVVLDGRTREVTASITGSRDFDVYRAAIDEAIAAARR